MEVTDVKIRLKQSGKLKAVAMVTLDNALIINDITLFENEKGKLIVQLPRTEKAKDNGQESVVPLSGELRHDITSEVKNPMFAPYRHSGAEVERADTCPLF